MYKLIGMFIVLLVGVCLPYVIFPDGENELSRIMLTIAIAYFGTLGMLDMADTMDRKRAYKKFK